MPLSRRYSPEWAAGESSLVGMDFSSVIPRGVGIAGGTLVVERNGVPPVVTSDFSILSPVGVEGRAVYVRMVGGVSGVDYRLVWSVGDTAGNFWVRTALLLCSPTS